MTSSSRGRRALQLVAILLAIPVLGGGGTFFWIRSTSARKWEDARRRIRELTAAFPERVPPLPSTETSKDLQVRFVAAIREAARQNSRAEEARQLVRSRQSGEAVDAVLADAQDFLDPLHDGARRCAEAPEHFPPGWRGEWDAATLRLIIDSGVLRARRLREKNSPDGAAETLMDSLQLARFWAASGKGDNRIDVLWSLDDLLEELRDLLARDPLSREQLQKMERELDAIDGASPPPPAYFERTLARWAEWLEAMDIDEYDYLRSAPYRWRWLLPKHLMKAEAFEFYDRHVQNLTAAGARSYLEFVGALDRLDREEKASKNPMITDSGFGNKLDLGGFDLIAQFRLLRTAARYRADGHLLKLQDPFGGQLLHSRTGDRMKFWSLGFDGRDDGGDAGSEGRWTPPGKDLVIEVPLVP